VRKGPWLMAPRPGGITVMIERERPGSVSVRAWELVAQGESEPGPFIVNDPSPTQLHELRLVGLKPGGRYRYEVTGPGLEVTGGTFNTIPDALVPFRFVLYGDTRGDARAHAAVMRAIAREGADFLVHTGDLVGDGRREDLWQQFFTIEREALRSAAWVPVVGNHELQSPSREGIANFRRYVHSEEDSPRPELDYTLRYGNVRLVLANAFDNWTSPHMRAWLDGALGRMRAEGPDDFVLVVLHWGMHSSGNHGENGALRRAGIADLLRRHRVDLVVAGHDHVYERGEERGLRYMVTGGGGAGLYAHTTRRAYARVFASEHHYVRVDVTRDALSFVALRPDGSILDRFSIQHPDARARVNRSPSAPDPPPSARVDPAPPRPIAAPPSGPSRACSASVRRCAATPDVRGALALCVAVAFALRRRRGARPP